MRRHAILLYFILSSIQMFALEWVSYGYTKRILFKEGIKTYEGSQLTTRKFAFEGNYLYMENYGVPGYTTGYGVYEGYRNGNLYYSVWFKGKNILGENFGPQKQEFVYFLVSPDKNTINLVDLDNMGRPSSISVYQKANTAPIDRMYK